MKKFKSIIALLLTLSALFALGACKTTTPPEDETVKVTYYNVTFNTVGGSALQGARVVSGGKISEPQIPTKDGYIFDYWMYHGKKWDFGYDTVSANTELTAMWIDASTVYEYTLVEGGVSISSVLRSFETMQVPSVLNGLSVVAIGEAVFAETSSEKTQKIILPTSVTSIGKNAFRKCKDVKIEVAGALTEVGELAFLDCNMLEKITLGEGIRSIPPQAFTGCTALKSVILPAGLEAVGENAFEDCIALTALTLPSSLTLIQDSAFIGCDALENVYFKGTQAQFDGIQIENGNEALKTAKLNIKE